MKSNNYKLWIKALRYGYFAQTKVSSPNLRDRDGYTALGVLCTIAVFNGIIPDYDPTGLVPVAVQDWIGLQVPYHAPFSLDDDGRTFEQYADAIESHAAELFN